ncbi:M15 family metallopeptidase [Methylobacterium sp. R2-1]|uniref:M15 family metallopeptidase n=1 Tax=Methylobacterium sp. R2-1 TaxID=2587064 RepID=UPI0016206CEC|nr:M15 family metallopeptidase [Methylobacterium sp. R2-1]MBB2960797.1 peptidoglycan L-alanyl-D-glutamate endopeptidase CwlK [Methylobacterium sp. R2-1]
MSLQLFKSDVLFTQRILAVSGYYKGPLNAKWTAAVDQAEFAFDADSDKLATELGTFDKRSERNIETLLPAAQRLARQFLNAASTFPYSVRIISGTRTYLEQDALFAIGRTTQLNKKPVTKAKGGQSNHNFSIAWDVGIFDTTGKYFTGATKKEEKAYSDLAGHIAKAVDGLEWGGNWSGFPDMPHYQVATDKSLKKIRTLFEEGKPFLP